MFNNQLFHDKLAIFIEMEEVQPLIKGRGVNLAMDLCVGLIAHHKDQRSKK